MINLLFPEFLGLPEAHDLGKSCLSSGCLRYSGIPLASVVYCIIWNVGLPPADAQKWSLHFCVTAPGLQVKH